MIPILLVTNTQESSEKYIKNFVIKEDFDESYSNKISPIKKELAIEQIRILKKEIMISSPKKRLYTVDAFDMSGLEVQNALLKTLEEKTEFIQFIFPIKQLWNILPTIISRCKIVQLEKSEEVAVRNETKKLVEVVITSKDLKFLSAEIITGKDREETAFLLEELILYFRTELVSGSHVIPSILKHIIHNRSLLLNNNLNPQLTLDTTLLYIYNTYKTKQTAP